ncbi:hypothetical protein [Streptomyces sp. NBC_01217]|uniref:hypothetical protein n=1 Tax=Streptomyces sp. NBC_01217 TaxID=2903779 RepID=UPI002E14A62D|nr:hypothetical protein OG507_02260 [Streptomyces sp. NBC_01217]
MRDETERRALEQATQLIADYDHEVFAEDEWKDLGTALTRLGEALWRERKDSSLSGVE